MEKRIIIEIGEKEVKAFRQSDNYRELLQKEKTSFDEILDQSDLEDEIFKLSELIRKIKLRYCEYTIKAVISDLAEMLSDQQILDLRNGLLKYCNVKLYVVKKEPDNS